MNIKRLSMLAGAVLVLSCLAAGAAPAFAADARTIREQGTEALQQKRYAEAIEHFTRAIKLNKGEISIENVAGIFNERGLAHAGLQRYDDAVSDFGNAIRLDDRNAAFYNNRGLASLNMRNYEASLEDFSKAISLSPAHAAYYNNRGTAHLRRQNLDEAVADFSKAVELDPRHVPAYGNRGMAHKSRLQYDKALRDFDKALEIAPKDPAAGYQKAAVYALQGKIDVACTWLEIAIDNGFRDWAAIRNNPDFDGIRKTDCYRKIMAGK